MTALKDYLRGWWFYHIETSHKVPLLFLVRIPIAFICVSALAFWACLIFRLVASATQ